MGCGTSNQVHAIVVSPQGTKYNKLEQSVPQSGQRQQAQKGNVQEKKQQKILSEPEKPQKQIVKKKKTRLQRNSFCFLFGQTATERKIICFDSRQLNFSTISSKTKIPSPPLKYQPIQVIYQQSQELFSSNLFSHNSHPPYNFMLAITLDNQKIFLCGGVNYDFDYISSESFYFDMNSDSNNIKNKLGHNLMGTRFQKLPFMHVKRFSHMGLCYAVDNVKYIYVFGGRSENEEILADCQRFSLVQKKWKKISPMNTKRSTGFCMAFKNKIYVFGGYSGNKKRSTKIQVYHPQKNYWEFVNFRLHRGIETGYMYSNKANEVVIVGGNLQFGAVKSVCKYNFEEQTYIYQAEMKHERVLQKGIITNNNQVIVFGGNFGDGLQIYNAKEKRWRQNQASYTNHLSVDDINSFSYSSESIYVQHEQIPPNKNQPNSDEKYCIFSNDQTPCIMELNANKLIWKKKPVPMTLKLKSFMGSVQLKPGKHFICGGVSQYMYKANNRAYIYYLNTNNCVQQSKMNNSRYNFGICKYEQFVYVFGGKRDQEGGIQASCQRFDIEKNKWTKLANLNRGRHSCLAMAVKDKIYLVGGADELEKIEEIEMYDPKSDQFKSLGFQNTFCIEGAFYIQNTVNQIFIFGGINVLGENHNIYKFRIDDEAEDNNKLVFEKLDNVNKVLKAIHTVDNGVLLLRKNKTIAWKDGKFEEKAVINQTQLGVLELEKTCLS